MGSYQYPKHGFNSEELDDLQWVFDSVWTTVRAHHPSTGPKDDERLKSALRSRLFKLACNGMNEPESLRSQLLNDLPLCCELLLSLPKVEDNKSGPSYIEQR